MENSNGPKRLEGWVGTAVYGLALTGCGSLVAGFMSVANASNEGIQTGTSYLGAGVCGIAAAIGFGLLLMALIHK